MNVYKEIKNDNGEWVAGEPTVDGQEYRTVYDAGTATNGYQYGVYHDETLNQVPVIELTDIAVSSENVQLGAGDIWWIPQSEPFTLTANIALPDTQMMIIIERVANGSTVIDDMRVKASIVGGVVTINAALAHSGNYQITAERLNKGLETIGAQFRLAFDKVEFDAYA